MRCERWVVAILVVLSAGLALESVAEDLVGVTSGGILFRIDKQTGALTRIGTTGSFNSLASDSQGLLYTVESLPGVRNLLRFDPATGNTSFVMSLSRFFGYVGSSFDSSDTLFLIADADDDVDVLIRVNITTGETIHLGPTGTQSIQGIAFDDSDALFGVRLTGELFQINTTTATAVLIGGGGSFEYGQGLAFDDNNELFSARRSLVTLDRVTGSPTLVSDLSCDPPLPASCDFRGLTAVALPDVQHCGGATGSTCGAGLFCNIPEGCNSGTTGVCVAIPASCPSEESPVCGCDGADYLNECMANMAGATVDHVGTCGGLCGGPSGILCPADQFCQLPRQSCCCDYFGTCVPIVLDCRGHCQPVCGCDQVTYKTECDAIRAGVATYRPGRCNEVQGIRFVTAHDLEWPPVPGATGYNVYVDREAMSTESESAACYAAGLTLGAVTIPGLPGTGELWQIEVTATFPDGEGPGGLNSLCRSRRATQSCGNWAARAVWSRAAIPASR